jgi:hypothetical protein
VQEGRQHASHCIDTVCRPVVTCAVPGHAGAVIAPAALQHCVLTSAEHTLPCPVASVLCCPQLKFLSSQQQQKAAQYDRNHPGETDQHLCSIVGAVLQCTSC